MRVWMRMRGPFPLVAGLVQTAGLLVAIGLVEHLFEGLRLTLWDASLSVFFAAALASLYVKRRRLRFLVIGNTGLVVCNLYARPRWYPWDAVERVTFGFIHAKTANGKRRREPMYPGWNVQIKERRALRRYLESVGPPQKLKIDTQP